MKALLFTRVFAVPDSAITKYLKLPRRERKIFWAAWWLLPRVMFRLRRSDVAATRAWLEGRPLRPVVGGLRPASSRSLVEAREIARRVNTAARFGLFRVQCLEKSLVTEALLRARGIECGLRFAVHNDGRPFAAHAWVEVQGEALGDRGASDPSLTILSR